jgi:IclR family acetate operon transcriptional repressor
LIVAVEDSPHPLRASSRPGFLADLHCSSTGKTFLAFLYRDRLSELYSKSNPTKRTPKTKTTLSALKADTDETARRGFSLDDEEFNPGVRFLAAPVFGADATAAAAVGITASTVRFTQARIPEMAAAVKDAAAELSILLGHSGGKTRSQPLGE